MDHGQLKLGNTDEQVYMWSCIDRVDQSKMVVDQVKWGHEDFGDRAVKYGG